MSRFSFKLQNVNLPLRTSIIPNLQTKIEHLYTSLQFDIDIHFQDVQD